jgi:hypothetical protein
MKAISFAHTTPAVLAGVKHVTRRDWKPRYARSFKAGELVYALDKNFRNGGQRVAIIRLTENPSAEWTVDARASDYAGEGFAWLHEHGIRVFGLTPPELWQRWQAAPEYLYVVRFELVEVLEVAR